MAKKNRSRRSLSADQSAANLGADKDSDKRQREAIAAFAKHNGYVIASEYFDAAVPGADPIDDRPGFKALIERIASNGVRTVIVEDASRFARTLMVQEAGIAILVSMGSVSYRVHDSPMANGVTGASDGRNSLTSPEVGLPKRSTHECLAECASELLPRVGLAKHFDLSRGLTHRERHIAVSRGQQHLEIGLHRANPPITS